MRACMIVIAMMLGGLAAAAQAQAVNTPPSPEPQGSWPSCAQHLRQHAQALADRARAEYDQARKDLDARVARVAIAAQKPVGLFVHDPQPLASGRVDVGSALAWRFWTPAVALPPRVVLLVHGLDETGDVWDDLTPRLVEAGHTVTRFEYPNDQSIARSAEGLAAGLRDLRRAGVGEVSVVAFSMGGLVTLDVLTRSGMYGGSARGRGDLPDLPRLVLLGTPAEGSPWAGWQWMSEAAEAVTRAQRTGDAAKLLSFMHDGRGEAARDLAPGSAFLTELWSRPSPTGVRTAAVVGRLPVEQIDLAPAERSLAEVVGAQRAQRWAAWARESMSSAAQTLGDGVVPVSSAAWPGADRVVVVRAGHRGMIARGRVDRAVSAVGLELDQTPAIGIVLDELAR